MSFIGAIASSVRQVLANFSRDIDLPVLIVGAGNFTVPSVLRSGGYQGPIHCCDVALYTSALGAYLTDAPFEIAEKPDCPAHLRDILRTDNPLETTASIALLYDLKEVWQLKNPFQERYFNQSRERWDSLMATTMSKLEAYKKHIGKIEYQAKDGFDFLAEYDPRHTVVVFPPTYKRGYERLEKLLRVVIEWPAPPYREMTDKSLELYERIAAFDSYFVVLEKDLPEVHAILGQPVAVLPRGRGSYTYILAKHQDKKIVIRKTIKSSPIGPIWPPDQPVTGDEKLSFAKITLSQSIRLNELYLASGIDYFSGGIGESFAFLLDGHVIGKADFCPTAHQWKLPEEKPMIYLMSDLAVASDIKKLSKLILLCLLSREVKEVLDLHYIEGFKWAITTAFSKHPVSMKYRGIFKLHKRKEVDNGNMLNYYAPFGDYSISEALEIWKKRYNG